MQLLFIRHGDPDYDRDSLTECGWAEAEALARYLQNLPVTDYYVSPLGRARDTASCTLKATGRTARMMDWLQELPALVDITDRPSLRAAYPDQVWRNERLYASSVWDMLPEYWSQHPEYLDREAWRTSEAAEASNVVELYDGVIAGLDQLLAEHGYARDGFVYQAVRPNRERLAFFCHFGLECVLLSHLMNVSPFLLWHTLVAAPTSVTVVNTEERREGVASFRVARFGDISHLALEGRDPSFSARFCETFDCAEERH